MTTRLQLVAIGLAGLIALSGCTSLPRGAERAESRAARTAAAAAASPPVSFEANVGQADLAVRFLARGRSHVTLLTDDGAVLVWSPATVSPARTVRIALAGSRPGATPEGEAMHAGRVNYFAGADPAAWRADVPTFARVRYREVYPGVDLVWHGSRGPLEFDLVVAPGADPGRILLDVEGAGALAVDADGRLVIGDGGVVLGAPHVYQDGKAGRREVGGRYVLRGANRVAVALGRHDPSRPLVIDPVVFFSSYFGGSGDETAVRFAGDAGGNLYVAGTTNSFDLTTLGGLQGALPGFRSCFVTKLDPSGSLVLFSTYLGGSLDDRCLGMAVDGPGNVYLTGSASSANFPITFGAVQIASGGGGTDAFVAKIAPTGNALLYSTFLGGSGADVGRGVAIDDAGGVWVSGTTTSLNFPRKNAFQSVFRGIADGFLARLDTTKVGLASLIFSTYFGGSGADGGNFQNGVLAADGGVAVDGAGNAFVTGSTTSIDLPLSSPAQGAFQGVSDAFVAKFGPGGALLWSTYLGGGSSDVAFGAATDTLGNVYVVGSTTSIDFPIFAALQPVKRNGADGFVAKFGPGGALIYSTFYGGSNDDSIQGIFVDAFARAHLTGETNSLDLPLVQAVQFPAGGGSDAFVAVLGPAGVPLELATYLGGSGAEAGAGVFADRFGVIHVAGTTGSLDFPLVNALQFGLRGASDAFLVRIGSLLFAHAAVLPTARSVQSGTTATFFATIAVTGAGLAIACRIDPVTPTPTTFLFQTTDPATNALVGLPNLPINIFAGDSQSFLIAFGTGPAFPPTEITLRFGCANTPPAQLVAGVNQPILSVSATPVPDIVALAATPDNDGIVTLSTPVAPAPATEATAGAFSVATVNLGAGARITVSADDNGAGLGLSLFVCRTDPATSFCIDPPGPALALQVDPGATPTFAVFAVAQDAVPFDPARNRIFVRFRDDDGNLRGATSAAVRTPPAAPAARPPLARLTVQGAGR